MTESRESLSTAFRDRTRLSLTRALIVAPSPKPTRQKLKLLDQMREALRSRHYNRRTEATYCTRVKRFIYFHNVRHPAEMAEPEISAFLTHLAVKERISASTQNQALSALLFLYRNVLVDESILQKAFKQAVGKTGFTKRATCHALRHSFAIYTIDGADATRRTSLLRIAIHLLSRRFAPGHQAAAVDSRPREQARVNVSH